MTLTSVSRVEGFGVLYSMVHFTLYLEDSLLDKCRIWDIGAIDINIELIIMCR